eukprot:10306949-Heterocapsa_arctica.AAC.1
MVTGFGDAPRTNHAVGQMTANSVIPEVVTCIQPIMPGVANLIAGSTRGLRGVYAGSTRERFQTSKSTNR